MTSRKGPEEKRPRDTGTEAARSDETPGGGLSGGSGLAEEAFIDFLKRREKDPSLSLADFCAGNGEVSELVQGMGRLWKLLEADLGAVAPERTGDDASPAILSREPPSLRVLLDSLERHRNSKDYHVLDRLAAGGMSEILRAWDDRLRRIVAMKISPEDLDLSRSRSRRLLARLLDEAQINAQLQHPAILPVHDLGLDAQGRLFFTMPVVRGRHLGEIIDLVHRGEGEWTLARALSVTQRICEAMAYAHSKGVIHRDLKPSNVMVGRFGETYVMDWGLAKVTSPAPELDPPSIGVEPASLEVDSMRRRFANDTPVSSLLTVDGQIVGTPAYMAPEQAEGQMEDVGPRADVYSIGTILYQLLTGRRPYCGDETTPSAEELLAQVRKGPPEPLEKVSPTIPAELVSICEKAMARDPAGRYGDVLDLSADIQAYLEGRVVLAHRTGAVAELRKWLMRNRALGMALILGIGGIVLGLVGILAVSEWSRSQSRQREEELARVNAELAAEKAASMASVDLLRREAYFNAIAEAARSIGDGDSNTARTALGRCPEELRAWEWFHLKGLTDASVWTAREGDHKVVSLVAPSGESWFASATFTPDHSVRIHDLETGSVARRMPLHTELIAGLALSPDGGLLASGGRDFTVRVTEVETGRGVRTLSGLPGRTLPIGFKSGDQLFLCASRDVYRCDLDTGALTAFLAGHDFEVESFALDPEGTILATGDAGGKIQLSSAESGNVLRRLSVPGRLTHLDFVDSESLLATTTRFGFRGDFSSREPRPRLHLLDPEEGSAIRTIELPGRGPHAALSPDRSRIAVARGVDVGTHDARTLELLDTLRGHETDVSALTWRDDRTLLTADLRGSIKLWRPDTAGPISRLSSSEGTVRSLALNTARRLLASGHEKSGKVIVWDLESRSALRTIATGHGHVVALGFSPDGTHLVTAGQNQQLCYWDPATGQKVHDSRLADRTYSLAISPDGRRVATGDWNGLGMWSLPGGSGARKRDLPVFGVDFSPDGSWIVHSSPHESGSPGSCFVTVRDAESLEIRSQTRVSAVDALGIAISPGGDRIAVCLSEGGCLVLDAGDLSILVEAKGKHEGRPMAVAWLPEGERFVTSGEDGTARIWDARTGRSVLVLRASERRQTPGALAVSEDGRFIAAGDGADIMLWEGRAVREPGSISR